MFRLILSSVFRVLFPINALLFGLVAATAFAEPAVVKIENIENAPLADTVSVKILLDSPHSSIALAGFDLLLTYDITGMAFLGANPGPLLNACGWEYFTYRFGIDSSLGFMTYPLVRLVALADINNGPAFPSCLLNAPGELARLDIMTTATPSAVDNYLPIRFYWRDCGDNIFVNAAADTQLISNRVFDFGYDITADGDLPTFAGAPSTCLASGPPQVQRGVNFHHGSVSISPNATPPDAAARVMLSPGEVGPPGGLAEFAVELQHVQPDRSFTGFDFLVRFDPATITFSAASPGALLDSCGWEYFVYSSGAQANCGGTPCPAGILRVVAVADVLQQPGEPSCRAHSPGILADLSFVIADNDSLIGRPIILDWCWYDCADNSLASPLGDSLYISQTAYDQYGQPVALDPDFPTLSGAPDSCADGTGIVRGIDFFSGSARIDAPSIDYRGDVNLNGLQYEVADYVLFSNYFYYALGAFTLNPGGQIAATDVNADGVVLSLNDLVYLARIIAGDALPFPRPALAATDTAIIVQDGALGTVTLTYPDSLRAIYLVFAGPVLYDGPFAQMSEPWHHLGGNTPLLAAGGIDPAGEAPFLPPSATGLQLCTFTGFGAIISAEASYDGLSFVPVRVIVQSMPSCCQLRGDFDYSGSITISDITAFVGYLFRSGPPSACAEHTDVDGSEQVNVVDLTDLVAFLFRGGPPPALCP